jgi:hypothetical protein
MSHDALDHPMLEGRDVAVLQQSVDDRSEQEEGMVFERLAAIKELREEMRRIENETPSGVACNVSIPAGWLPLLERGLKMMVAQTKQMHAGGEISDSECREQVAQAERLAAAVDEVEPGKSYCVGSDYYPTLHLGLRQATKIQYVETARLSNRGSPGQQFIAGHSLAVLSKLIWLLHRRMG